MKRGKLNQSDWASAKIVLGYIGVKKVKPMVLAKLMDTSSQRAAIMLAGIGWERRYIPNGGGYTEWLENGVDMHFIGRVKNVGIRKAARILNISKSEAALHV